MVRRYYLLMYFSRSEKYEEYITCLGILTIDVSDAKISRFADADAYANICMHEDPRKRMHMQISKDGDPRMRMQMRISVQEDPQLRMRMRIFEIL